MFGCCNNNKKNLVDCLCFLCFSGMLYSIIPDSKQYTCINCTFCPAFFPLTVDTFQPETSRGYFQAITPHVVSLLHVNETAQSPAFCTVEGNLNSEIPNPSPENLFQNCCIVTAKPVFTHHILARKHLAGVSGRAQAGGWWEETLNIHSLSSRLIKGRIGNVHAWSLASTVPDSQTLLDSLCGSDSETVFAGSVSNSELFFYDMTMRQLCLFSGHFSSVMTTSKCKRRIKETL